METLLIIFLVISIGLLLYGTGREEPNIPITIIGFFLLIGFASIYISLYTKPYNKEPNIVVCIKNKEVKSSYMSNDTTYIIIK